jgi:hypothetical protein
MLSLRLNALFTRTLLGLALVLGLTACDSNDPSGEEGAGDAEVISNVTITLTNADDASDTVTADAVFNEAGELTSPPRPVQLQAGATYEGTIAFENRFASEPAEQDITAEVREEAVEHQVFYVLSGAAADDVTVTVTDRETDYVSDSSNNMPRSNVPVGLTYTVDVADSPSGSEATLRVVLGHYDERAKTDSETVGDVPEIDVDVDFGLLIGTP